MDALVGCVYYINMLSMLSILRIYVMDVLRDGVVASSPPEAVRSRFVVGQRDPADFAKLVVGEGLHGGTMPEREEIRTQGPGGQGPAWSRRNGLDGRIGPTLRAHAEGRRDIVDRW